MEHYDLRSCFLPDLSGLHLRIYQFQHLLSKHLPTLTAHLESLQIEPLYVSQWFLSFFGVTCPIPMLLRIYDVILTEGASETLMRVALSLMRRNESKILACTELEDVMGLLLSRALWDTYNCNADDLVNDFVGLTGLVTRESLETLEATFKDSKDEDPSAKISSVSNVQAAASRLLGRFWTGSHSSAKVTSPTSSLGVAAQSRPTSFLQRTSSKQSMASTLNSIDTSESQVSAASTDATAMSRTMSIESTPTRSGQTPSIASTGVSNKDKDLHNQIEDLLTALSDMQREQAIMAGELQKEREGREEDRVIVQRYIEKAKRPPTLQAIPKKHARQPGVESMASSEDQQISFVELEEHFSTVLTKRSSIVQTKHQLREDLKLWKDQYEVAATKSLELSQCLGEKETENEKLKERLQEAQAQAEAARREKQILEDSFQEVSEPNSPTRETDHETRDPEQEVPCISVNDADPMPMAPEEPDSPTVELIPAHPPPPPPTFHKRGASLGLQAVLTTENHKPVPDEALLLELVNAKTAEAVARQELDEVKAKLDSLRKIMGSGKLSTPSNNGHRPSPSEPMVVKPTTITTPGANPPRLGQDESKSPSPSTSGGGFFSGWGKRTASNPAISATGQEAS